MLSNYNYIKGTLLTIIAALLVASLSGCADATIVPSNDTADSSKPTYSSSSNPEETALVSIEDQKASVSKEQKDYYCEWSVSKVLGYGAAETYSKEDAEKLIGKTLSFSADEAQIFTDQPSDTATVIKTPSYKEVSISGSDFLTNFGMRFDMLGIDTDSVTELIVSGCGSSAELLIKDSNSMILVVGGTYFELSPLRS
ncbi:MAG: hypothetical protein VB071_13005 [Lawsonibacter sp.]|nr:hypothetical protein [Lawsonibacter sp.]